MRTTLTLPPDLHDYIRELAHRQRQTMSEVVVQLLRRAQQGSTTVSGVTLSDRGIPVVSVGRRVTNDDVRSLDDDLE